MIYLPLCCISPTPSYSSHTYQCMSLNLSRHQSLIISLQLTQLTPHSTRVQIVPAVDQIARCLHRIGLRIQAEAINENQNITIDIESLADLLMQPRPCKKSKCHHQHLSGKLSLYSKPSALILQLDSFRVSSQSWVGGRREGHRHHYQLHYYTSLWSGLEVSLYAAGWLALCSLRQPSESLASFKFCFRDSLITDMLMLIAERIKIPDLPSLP